MITETTRKQPSPRKRSASGAKWTLRRAGGLQVLEAPALARLDWLVHGFSTRPGGASNLAMPRNGRETSEKVLNLGFADWDSPERVAGNRSKFFRVLRADKMRSVVPRQIHSDIVHRVDFAEDSPSAAPQFSEKGRLLGGRSFSSDINFAVPSGVLTPKAQVPAFSAICLTGDALFTRERGILLAIQTADCIPILLADAKRRAIAAVHAGWRGTLSRIAAKTVGRMRMEFGTDPADIVAALGPGIGRCCLEVGPEVAKEFAAQFPGARDWFDGPFDALASGENDPNWLPWLTMMPPGRQPPSPRVQLDLVAANRAILADAGVSPKKISSSGYCTACRADLFFSYRREQITGRQMAAIAIRGN